MTTKLTDWIAACCNLAPGGRELTSDLFDSYRSWAATAGAKPVGMAIFLKLLREHGVGVVQTNASGAAAHIRPALWDRPEMVAAAAPVPDARAARIPPSMIQVHLTPYAPECATLPVSHPKRWASFVGRPPERVMRALLTRLRRAPGDIRVRTDDPPLVVGDWADVDLMAVVDGVDAPVATFCRGVTAAEATAILADLVQAGWRPRDVLPAEQAAKPRDLMPPAATRTDLEQMESFA